MSTRKQQPKALDPLEKLVREQIANEYVAARDAMVRAQNEGFDADVSERMEEVKRALQGAALDKSAASDPLAGVPKADSGKALLGRWCVVWTRSQVVLPELRRIDSFDASADDGLPYEAQGDWFSCASPIERGVPEAIRKAVEG